MSLPKPPKQLVNYLSNGKAVCFDHHLRQCDRCCVDFAYGESDEDEPYEIDDQDSSQGFFSEDDEEDDGENDPDRVFVLVDSMARFIPQWDEEILSPRNTFQIKKDYKNPPKPLPLSSVHTYYCRTCQLTWLVGEIGESAARNHPSHHSYSHVYAGTSRSLFVFTDGACAGNGTPDARGRLGVFFGPGSMFNFAESLTNSTPPTSQKAELAAVTRALETVRSRILPARRLMVTDAQGGHNRHAVSDVMQLRLVVVTDSSYIVEGMCRHFSSWEENNEGVLVNESGKAVENSEAFLRLKSEVEELSMVGIQVVYYLVVREENKNADMLAKGSIA